MKKLFVDSNSTVGTAYWEFAPGNWDNKSFGCKDSIYIHDDILFHSDFFDVVLGIIPDCDPLGQTKISKEQWEAIREAAILDGACSVEIIQAAQPWVTDNFQKYDAFYILGV